MQNQAKHAEEHTTEALIGATEAFIGRGDFSARGDEAFARLFLSYLKRGVKEGVISNHEFTGYLHYLPAYVHEVYDLLRKGEDDDSRRFREMYIQETEQGSIPDLIEIAFSGRRWAAIPALGFLMERITGREFARTSIEEYFNAQDTVLKQTLNEFRVKVYRSGLFDRIQESRIRGMSGVFGSTELRTYVMAGSISFTFAPKDEERERKNNSVSFVGEEGEKEGVRIGCQSVYCDLFTACSFIREVIEHWPQDPDEQRKVFKDNEDLGLGIA